ncbi:MAG TPA: anti-sigma factor [Egicoccus sp.]|nr:anti-sigma factor [Egicoccus sp.]HSK22591.1 anti-sigma factor [Egicoccus sp.]
MTADIHTLTGAYAADALDDDERRFFERHLDDCEACAREVAELQATTARLGAAVAAPPPPDLRARVLAEIERTRQDGPRSRSDTAPGRRRARRAGRLAPAAAFVLLALGAGAVINDYDGRMDSLEERQARVDEVMAAPDATMVESHGEDGTMARAVVSPSMGEAVLVVDRMAPAPSDHTYELWLMGDDGATPAGMFDVDDSGRTTQLVSGDFDGAYAIGVTVEPMGGSPAPTSEPVMMLELGT